jgi:tRNA-specific 2-thiouridylase
MAKRQKIIVAMSGGVDSSVTAAMLVEQGHEVEGVSLRMWEAQLGARVCSDHRGAKEVAALLGIPHTLLDLRSQFVEAVVKPFAQDYLRGRTPNPCVSCNRDFKLGILLRWARAQGADFIASGHYARVIRADAAHHAALFRGADRGKDQSYFLFSLSQDQLTHALFPLGEMCKTDVRDRARKLGLPVAERPDSQDICLGDYHGLVESFAERGEAAGGEIVDQGGRVLGTHSGIHRFTIGQRKGLGLVAPNPLYVLALAADTRRVVVGTRDELGSPGLVANGVSWIEPPRDKEIIAEVQVRYQSPAIRCRVNLADQHRPEVYFDGASAVVTPGQAAVFYDGEQVLGGGWIERAFKK